MATKNRVRENTLGSINERIRRDTERSVARVAEAGPLAIGRRLAELDREWTIERYLQLIPSTLTLAGVGMGAARGRRWLIFPAVIAGFLLEHAIQGWCPPLPVLRRLGVRTRGEIDDERYALKALRGDFQDLSVTERPDRGAVREALQAVRR